MSWDEMATTWDDDPAVRAYSEGARRSLDEVLARHGHRLAGLRVLDFGCGTGLLTEALAPHVAEVVAVDVSPAMLAVLRAKALPNVRVVEGELADLGAAVPSGAFDLVVASSVCAFVPDYPETAKRLADRLRPGGLLVQWDWELDPTAEEPFGLSRDAIERALVGAGLVGVAVDVGFEQPYEGMVMRPLRGVGHRAG